MLAAIDYTRLKVSAGIDLTVKSQLGQFMTPAKTAMFMSNLFTEGRHLSCRLLDPGAGIGSLSAAFIGRWLAGELKFQTLSLTAYEIDDRMQHELWNTLQLYSGMDNFKSEICHEDFIESAVNLIQFAPGASFTHAILNPPYKKISSGSAHRKLLRQAEIETVNLYSAFMALTLELLTSHGQMVAIVPRSFCNGPYYRPFREFLLKRAAICHMHLFASRNKAFKDDNVLQENLIIKLVKGAIQGTVTVSTSADDSFEDYAESLYDFNEIVRPDDTEKCIHVPISAKQNDIKALSVICHTLDELNIKVSTGPVVDFRLKEFLRDESEKGCVPLLYSNHFSGNNIEWPKPGGKKPNAIVCNDHTRKWLYPNGYYCVVRRFSSKEERKRIVARVVRPETFPGSSDLGFENHLNVFHTDRHGLPEAVAAGLSVFLNSTLVDAYFRRFNGHTQVNATDLRIFKYPSLDILTSLGNWAAAQNELTQTAIDHKIEGLALL